jgi:hypothetical protein
VALGLALTPILIMMMLLPVLEDDTNLAPKGVLKKL